MKLIAMTGRAGAGKDEAAKYLIRKYKFCRLAFATRLKTMLHAGLGLDPALFVTMEEKNAVIEMFGCSYRHAAQTLGTDWGRVCINKDIWLDLARRDIEDELASDTSVVVTDVRFENEAKLIRQMGGTVVHIKRPGNTELVGAAQGHVSEVAISVGELDRVINNNAGIIELHCEVESIYQTSLEVA